MDGRYKVSESVGPGRQDVHSYEDLEKHHPTWKESGKRHYAQIDGAREEFVYGPGGERMVSKDFILQANGTALVDVPSPAQGYVRRSAAMDRWGTVEIYDGPGQDAHLVARIRHMQPIHVNDGDRIGYGEPLGQQGSKAPPGVKSGLHTHIDFNEAHLDQFKRYFSDIDKGVITTNTAPGKDASQVRGQTNTPGGAGHAHAAADVLKQGAHGSEVWGLQLTLSQLGYTARDGRPLATDRDFGPDTEHAVRAFQRMHGLQPVDGQVGTDTRAALLEAARRPLVSEVTHPQHGLYSAIALQLPRDTDPRVAANITLQALENGITSADKLGRMAVSGTDVHVAGTTPGFRLQVDLQAPTPSLQRMSDYMAQTQQTQQTQEHARQPHVAH